MVAPLPHRPEPAETSPALRRARRMVAAALLGPTAKKLGHGAPPVEGWKAWSFAIWTVVATVLAATLSLIWGH